MLTNYLQSLKYNSVMCNVAGTKLCTKIHTKKKVSTTKKNKPCLNRVKRRFCSFSDFNRDLIE